jgi:DNA-directed RNA polymerase specialized sigma24 family protein
MSDDSDRAGGRLSTVGMDSAAFEAFYRRHMEAVGRFVARRVSDPHTAADLTADVFLEVIESAAGYRPDRGSELAWLFGVARNVVVDEHRRAALRMQTLVYTVWLYEQGANSASSGRWQIATGAVAPCEMVSGGPGVGPGGVTPGD